MNGDTVDSPSYAALDVVRIKRYDTQSRSRFLAKRSPDVSTADSFANFANVSTYRELHGLRSQLHCRRKSVACALEYPR